MGEVATALAAFDDAFGRTLDALRASDVSEGSAWPTQKRASSLVLDLRRDVPAHVAAAKLVAAGELALSQGQWALAQTSSRWGSCARARRPIRDGTRTRRTTRKAKSRSVGSTAWRFTFAPCSETRGAT